MNQNAKQLLNLLCREYDKLSKCHHQRPFPEFSATIQNQHGFCYVRCPMGSQRFSIVNVRLSPSIRGQGVLTAFLEYIESHPYHYRASKWRLLKTNHWLSVYSSSVGNITPSSLDSFLGVNQHLSMISNPSHSFTHSPAHLIATSLR